MDLYVRRVVVGSSSAHLTIANVIISNRPNPPKTVLSHSGYFVTSGPYKGR